MGNSGFAEREQGAELEDSDPEKISSLKIISSTSNLGIHKLFMRNTWKA